MSLAVQVAIRGDLDEWVKRNKEAYLRALTDATHGEGVEFQDRLRAEVEGAGLGHGIANAWRIRFFPRTGYAYNPAIFLWSNAAQIIDGFTRGEPYGARNGQDLAIPIPGSPADSIRVRPGQKRTAIAAAKFGPLKIIRARSGVLMLVGFARGSASGALRPLTTRSNSAGYRYSSLNQGVAMVPLFWLVPNARLRKRLSWPDLAAKEKQAFAGKVAGRLRDYLGAARKPV